MGLCRRRIAAPDRQRQHVQFVPTSFHLAVLFSELLVNHQQAVGAGPTHARCHDERLDAHSSDGARAVGELIGARGDGAFAGGLRDADWLGGDLCNHDQVVHAVFQLV